MLFYKSIRIILIIIPIAALVFFTYRYVNPDGVLEIAYDFCRRETPYFSGLSPQGRVLELEKRDVAGAESMTSCWQQMVIDPVYFDVRLPQSYQSAKVILTAEIPDNQAFKLGVGIDPDAWLWEFGQQRADNTLNHPDEKSGAKKQAETEKSRIFFIDLNQAKFDNHRYRFIISASDLAASGQKIVFYDMRLRFEKQPLTMDNIGVRAKRLLNL